MPGLVLDKLRREVLVWLRRCVESKGRKLVRALDEVEGKGGEVVAWLEMRSGDDAVVDGEGRELVDVGKVPVYRLAELMGTEHVAQLPLYEDMRTPPRLAVLRHPRTVKFLMALDRLDMYTKPRDLPPQQKRGRLGG